MFVQQRARLAHSLASVEAVLGSTERWATGLDGAGGEQLLGRVGAHLSGLALYKQVRLHLAAAPIKVAPTRTVVGGQKSDQALQIDFCPPHRLLAMIAILGFAAAAWGVFKDQGKSPLWSGNRLLAA